MQKQCGQICRSYARKAPSVVRTPLHSHSAGLGGILAVWSYKTELSSRNSLPARVLPPASPCPHTITPCPSKMDLTGMESLWCADRAFLGAQKHTRLHFFEGSITGRQMGVISLQIHGERKGDGKSIVHVV